MNRDEFSNILFGERRKPGEAFTAEIFNRYLCEEELDRKSKEFKKIPIDKIISLLGMVGDLFRDRSKPYYSESVAELPSAIDLSQAMIETGLELFCELLSPDYLRKSLGSLGDYRSLDHFVPDGKNLSRRAVPVGSVCHIAAGNIFLGSVASLIQGIVTKNVNLLKVSSRDFLFPTLFFRALGEADREGIITPFVSMAYWDRNDEEIENLVKSRFDAILLFGGEDAVMKYKNGLSPKTELHSFGPKISFGLVTSDVDDMGLIKAAKGFAQDIALWEQRACTSCQNIFVEGKEQGEKLGKFISIALDELAEKWPLSLSDANSAVEIRKIRERALWDQFNKNAEFHEGKSKTHTVIVREGNDLQDSPLSRTVYINCVENYGEVLTGNMNRMKYYLSTMAIAAERNIQKITELFTDKGVMRFTSPGSMSGDDDPAAPHDGKHILNLLVRFISKGDLAEDSFGLSFLEDEKRNEAILARLNRTLKSATKSSFYRERLKNIKLPLKSLEEMKQIPILEKDDVYAHSIEKSNAMLTEDPEGSYIFSAGGTTGKMKYVYYSKEEFREAKKLTGQGHIAAGIEKTDRVANFFMAGAFWTAYLATNGGLEETGCTILPITANQPEAESLEYIRQFRPNVIMSIPGNLILLAQEVERRNETIRFDKIYYAGEHLSEPGRAYLRRVFQPRIIASLGYGAVETGPIGFICPECGDGEHHPLEEWCFTERDENGDILVTTLRRDLHPFIRYRLGDRVEMVEESCSCGRNSKRFKLLSRSDDVIRFNATNLYLDEVGNALSTVDDLSTFYQVVVENDGAGKRITFRIETRKPDENRNDIEKISRKVLKEKCVALGRDAKLNLIRHMDIDIVAPGTIERVGRTGKIRRIIDRTMEAD